MHKYVLSLVLVLFTHMAIGQIYFKPVFINQCKQDDNAIIFWFLSKNQKKYYPNYGNTNVVTVPNTGKYQLFLEIGEEPVDINISHKGTNIDTFFIPRLKLVNYVSSPPWSEFFDCDSLAQGKVTDRYYNQHVRQSGVFKDGQPVDTLFSYFSNGNLSEVLVPSKKAYKRTTYFPSGSVQSYQTNKVDFNFYESGILKSKIIYRKLRKTDRTFYEHGIISHIQKKNQWKSFNKNGTPKELIKRKEIGSTKRLLGLNKKFANGLRFHTYNWRNFDDSGSIKMQVTFHSFDLNMATIPDNLKQVKPYLLNEVNFYKQDKIIKRMRFPYILEEGKYVQRIVIYIKDNKRWIQLPYENLDKAYQLIESLSE